MASKPVATISSSKAPGANTSGRNGLRSSRSSGQEVTSVPTEPNAKADAAAEKEELGGDSEYEGDTLEDLEKLSIGLA
jgi:hypothetical protein